MDLLFLLGVVVVVVPSLYLYTVSVVATRFPTLTNKRICLLIAHPDDEAMFFAPTVLALTRPETGNHVKILCLSSGNATGLGETRKKELAKSGLILGLRKPDDVYVIDRPNDFPDSMTTEWDAAKISTLLTSAFAPQAAESSGGDAAQPPSATIDVLITFDAGGVSGHPNHISLHRGARQFVAGLVAESSEWAAPVDLYTLTSVSVARKYSGMLDTLATLGLWTARTDMKHKEHPGGLVFMSGLGGTGHGSVRTGWKAMTSAHISQMVWFRWGWITLSRYMYMNDLQLERVKGSQ